MVAVAPAHAFEQGNKRIGFVSGLVFMNSNGYELDEVADDAALAVAFFETITGDAHASSFEGMLRDRTFLNI